MKRVGARRIRLRIFKARISGFWQEFRRSKMGMLGLFMIAVFVFLAIFGPVMSPYDPTTNLVAAPMAMPQWVTLLPQYRDLSSSTSFDVQWMGDVSNLFHFQLKQDSALAALLGREQVGAWSASYVGNSSEETELRLTFNFTYNQGPPHTFQSSFMWRVLDLNGVGYNLELVLARNSGNKTEEYSLWDSNFRTYSPQRSTQYSYSFGMPGAPAGFPNYVELSSGKQTVYKNRLGFQNQTEFLDKAFSRGDFSLEFFIRLKPEANAMPEVQILDFQFYTLGTAHGLLGTDNVGRDVFSQVLYGTRISLEIGLLVAVLSTAIGVFVGTLSGYLGGLVDEASMRIVDLLMCLPLFPLILAAATMFGRNLYVLILLVVFLNWMTLSRMVRSQVLSLREMPFVEAAVASGCTKFRILRRHIIPNIMPLAFTAIILSVPAAILLEASLSFVGLGDPSLVTWGRTINQAMAGGALQNNAWWWLFSPGAAIVLVCLSFVFLSHALDGIINPRMRTRK